MSVKIRLALTGKKHQISYRLVAQDTRSKRDGKFLEILGYFNPSEKDKNRTFVDKEKIKFWLKKGATFTKSAKYLTEKGELPPKPKKKVEPKKETAPKQEVKVAEAEQPESEASEQEPQNENTTAEPQNVPESTENITKENASSESSPGIEQDGADIKETKADEVKAEEK